LVEAVLGAALLLGAGFKAHQLLSRSTSVILGLLHGKLMLAELIQLELLLALWLLIGGFPRSRFITSITCFGLFACVAFYEAARAMPSCECFGNVKVPPLVTGSFDLAAVTSLWFTRPAWDSIVERVPSRQRLFFGLTLAGLLSTGLWSAYAVRIHGHDASIAAAAAAGDGALVVLEPENWVNKPFPLLDEIDGAKDLRSGRWLVVLYHYDCDSCLEAIPRYRAFAVSEVARNAGIRVAFIAMPPTPVGADPVGISPNYLHLALRPDHDWFATTPVAVALENARVIEARQGDHAVAPPDIPGWRR
jgi:hypothetical protein